MNIRRILWIGVALFALAQLVPVPHSNPPVEEEVAAPAEARAILERACYQCHSHATEWPWYARVAPASWLLAYDVTQAREKMNFSTWNRYGAEKRSDHLEEIDEVVSKGEMPPWFYLPMHPEARLSDADLATLRAWTGSARSGAGEPHEHSEHAGS